MTSKHHHVWVLKNVSRKGLSWTWTHSECACGAVQKDCSECDGAGSIVEEKKKTVPVKKYEHDYICKNCKVNDVNHTLLICTPCAREALKNFKFAEGFDLEESFKKMEKKKHTWGDNRPGFRCVECQLGWWGDTHELSLPECGSEEALRLAEWQLTEGKRKDKQSIEERLKEADGK